MTVKPNRLIRQTSQWLSRQTRDPRYVFVLLWSLPLFAITTIQAMNRGWFDSLEKPVFHFVNSWPHWLTVPMYILTQFGSFGSIVFWVAIAWYLINRRAAITVAVSGFFGWLLARIAKAGVHRDRPQDLLHHINLFHNHLYTGYGFPSGHSTFSAACATVLYYQLKPRYRKYLLGLVVLVGLSRMYLGAHFPLDVVGGWALGAGIGAIISLVVGSARFMVSVPRLKKLLAKRGLPMRSITTLHVDARGSRPLLLEGEDGTPYFGKLFGRQEHAADWLFKMYRYFRYKNLQAEEPYVNARRNVEIEAFATMWAKKTGARVPAIISLNKVGTSWLLLQERVAAKPLPDHKRITEALLKDAWRQVKRLHEGNLAHRDLRSANLMADGKGQVWIIDFGFAEVAPNMQRKSMDVAELLMSLSLLVGAKRAVASAREVLGAQPLRQALPYLQKSVFSGATLSGLRQQKDLLAEVRNELKQVLRLKQDVQAANIDRFNLKKLLGIGLLALFVYLVLPQFRHFKGSLESLENWRFWWAMLALVFSILSYYAAAAMYVILSQVPLRLREAAAIQLAASFVSKIVPGGIGGTSLNARYLTRVGLEAPEASAVITAQSVIGFIMFIVPLALFLVFAGHSLSELLRFHISRKAVIGGLSVIVVGSVCLSLSRKLRTKVLEFGRRLLLNLRDLSTSPRELALAAAASLLITICYVGCLYACVHAFHGTLSIGACVLVYASAMIAKSVIPTPGGLGPVEVTMAASLINLGMVTPTAYAAVIIYRLATFWLPVPFSLLAYHYVNRKQLI